MHLEVVIHALNVDLRRRIVRFLCKEDMTATEVFSNLKEHAPRYRQSVNKALEILKQSGLLRKYYDDKAKALYYGVVKKTLLLNLQSMTVE